MMRIEQQEKELNEKKEEIQTTIKQHQEKQMKRSEEYSFIKEQNELRIQQIDEEFARLALEKHQKQEEIVDKEKANLEETKKEEQLVAEQQIKAFEEETKLSSIQNEMKLKQQQFEQATIDLEKSKEQFTNVMNLKQQETERFEEFKKKISTRQLGSLSQQEVTQVLIEIGQEKHANSFQEKEICGDNLSGMTDSDLKDIGVASFKERKQILHHFELISQCGVIFAPQEITSNQSNPSFVLTWTNEQVSSWLKERNVPNEIIAKFTEERVDGEVLITLSKDNLSELGITEMKLKNSLYSEIKGLKDDCFDSINSFLGQMNPTAPMVTISHPIHKETNSTPFVVSSGSPSIQTSLGNGNFKFEELIKATGKYFCSIYSFSMIFDQFLSFKQNWRRWIWFSISWNDSWS